MCCWAPRHCALGHSVRLSAAVTPHPQGLQWWQAQEDEGTGPKVSQGTITGSTHCQNPGPVPVTEFSESPHHPQEGTDVPHFTRGDIKAQSGWLTYPRPHSDEGKPRI